jgi:PAS domain S-box-containing protein
MRIPTMHDCDILTGHVPIKDFLRAFPFYFAWDDDGLIVSVGPSLMKLCSQSLIGMRLDGMFDSQRPAGDFSVTFARENPDQLFILKHKQKDCILRGTLMFLDELKLTVMLAAPWITHASQLQTYGLTLNDFGLQDQTLDLLQLLQTQDMAAADLRRLNETLVKQRTKLREQEAQSRKLALVAARTDNAVVITDATGLIEWVNEAFVRMTGWTLQEVLGRKPGEFLSGPDTDRGVVRYMSEALRAKRGFKAELQNYRKDGAKFWLAIEVQPLVNEAGEVTNFMAIESDITARKRDQEALETYRLNLEELVQKRTQELESNKFLLEAIVTTTPNGLLLIDREGRIRMTNAALEAMFGYSASELLDRQIEDLVPLMSRDSHERQRSQYMLNPTVRPMGKGGELVGQRKDASVFPIEVSLAAFSIKEEKYVQATVSDITTRKQSEKELRDLNNNLERIVEERTQQLIAASAAKSEFLAHMSHEIRTPMNGILGFTQLLEREFLTPNQSDMVRRIRQTGQSLLSIINDILDFSKIEAGQLRIENTPFDLARILAQVDSLLGATAREKGIELRVNNATSIKETVIGDPLRLEQVLMNLCGNAIKFTNQGEVNVRVELLARSPSSLRVHFEVTDTGIGIDPKNLDGLFMPFAQADATITRRFGGSGLGLSISKRLVQLMGGEIGVDSLPGVGSKFWFDLPFPLSQEEPALYQTPLNVTVTGEPRLSGFRCLVVDDSRMNRDIVERMLNLEGAHVILAADGQQAVQLLRSQSKSFDAVLMDVQMPVMDGLAATRVIRNELCLKDIPVIALTAGVLAEQRRQAADAGCNDFIAKPVDLEELVAALLRWTRETPIMTPVVPKESVASLPAIAGLDCAKAVRSLGGDEELFLSLLADFVEEFGETGNRVCDAVRNEDRAGAARLLHAMRGAAGYIGATEISKKAKSLEVLLSDAKSDVTAHIEDFGSEFQALIREISETISNRQQRKNIL